MNRVLKSGGKALITVWAKEQKYKEKESFYISTKGNKKSKNDSIENSEIEINNQNASTNSENTINHDDESKSTNVHKFGKEFQKKDLFVAWHYNPKSETKKLKNRKNSNNLEANDSNNISALNEQKSSNVYLRFYHVFENNELESLFNSISNTRIVESFYEQGNWCVVFEKI